MAKQHFALVDDSFSPFKSSHIKVKVAKSEWEKKGYYDLRKKTFSKEQKLLPENEKDASDFRAIPIVALSSSWSIGDEIVGAVRIYQLPDEVNTWYGGRLCVSRAYRGHLGIGKALINEAVSRAIDMGCECFLANVQKQNEKYFHSVHWETIKPIEIAGRPHVHMMASLDKYPFITRDPE